MDIREIFFYIFLGILIGTAVLEFSHRKFLVKCASRIFLYTTGLIGAYLICITLLQLKAFQEGPLPLLSAKGGLLWSLGYVRFHYINDYLVSFLAAIIFASIGYALNKKYNGRFFEKEELYLVALGILLVGYPGFIFYIPLVLLASAIASLFFVKRGERLPLYHFWIPTAIFILVTTHMWAGDQMWWAQFRF